MKRTLRVTHRSDLQGLNLGEKDEEGVVDEPPPKMSIAREKVLEEAKKAMEEEQKSGKKGVSLVVIGMIAVLLFCFILCVRLMIGVRDQGMSMRASRR